jgi:hypothetical protein
MLGSTKDRQLEKTGPRLVAQGMETRTGDTDQEPECEQERHTSPATGGIWKTRHRVSSLTEDRRAAELEARAQAIRSHTD